MTPEELINFPELKETCDPILFFVEGYEKPFLGLFNCCRIPSEKVPKGCFKYSIREDDYGEGPATIEPFVMVNHFGDVITASEIEFGENGYLDIQGIDWGTFDELEVLALAQ